MSFQHTRRALAEFDRREPDRDRMARDARNLKEIVRWQHAEELAIKAVQEAFFLDTSHVNSMGHCYAATISYMRECVARCTQ